MRFLLKNLLSYAQYVKTWLQTGAQSNLFPNKCTEIIIYFFEF